MWGPGWWQSEPPPRFLFIVNNLGRLEMATPRINTIHTPKEEMAELKISIQAEKDIRRSLRISSRDSYYSAQKEYLDLEIAKLQRKLDILTSRYENATLEIKASEEHEAKLQHRLLMLENISKLQRFEDLKNKLMDLTEGM